MYARPVPTIPRTTIEAVGFQPGVSSGSCSSAAGAMSRVAATVLIAPAALLQLPDETPGWKSTASIVVLGVVGTGLAYIFYFAIILGAGASRAILVTYLVPAMALLYGAVFLDEAVTAVALGGLALVLGGVALGTGAVGTVRR